MAMQQVLAGGGAFTLTALAVLFWFVWQRLRYPSAPWFCAAFATAGALYAAYALLGTDVLQATPDPLALARTVAGVLFGQALVQLTGLPAALRRRLSGALLAYGLVAGALTAWLPLGRGGQLLVWLPLALGQVTLFAWMARREPRHGHSLVCVALLLLPLGYAVAATLSLPLTWVRYQAPAPCVLVAMAALMVRMIRDHDHLTQALDDRTAAQQALQDSHAQLDLRVRERTQELELLLQHQDSFNRSVAHDLRGPLGSIAGYARVLQEALDRRELDLVRSGLARLADTADQVVRSVQALLRLARASETRLQRQPVALQPLARAALAEVLHTPGQREDPQAVLLKPLPQVVGDGEVLRQLFVNLLANALKFSRGSAPPRVVVGCQQAEDGTWVMHVSDNGVGFSMAHAQRLFEPFVRLHGRHFEGSGVGLSICQRIVQRHGGEIWAESQPGRGTVFRFTLGQPRPPAGMPLHDWSGEPACRPAPAFSVPAAPGS